MQEVWALKDINFEIKRGESVAIIGRNGGGRSTLLEILTGTLTPTSGRVKVNGRVSALLELGSGFNPEYSGRDNVVLNGLLLGLSKAEILSRFDEIEAFAEIGAAIDRPVKTYSSGMLMRLAFAVQVLCDPDILIIDEALSVGDFFFQQKCLSYIRELCIKGVTLLFVSHDMGTVRDLCSRVVFLKSGRLAFDGSSNKGIPLYFKSDTEKIQELSINSNFENKNLNVTHDNKTASQCIRQTLFDSVWKHSDSARKSGLVAVALLDQSGQPSTTFKMGEYMKLRVMYLPFSDSENHVGISILDKYGATKTAIGTMQLHLISRVYGMRLLEFTIKLMLEGGQYGLNVNLGYEMGVNTGIVLDETGMLGPINITWDYEKTTAPFLGQVGLPVTATYMS
jgi:lipopolysaccharide transport system ATP-binding protein